MVALLVVATAVMWFARRRGPAWSMEEAMMLQAPLRVLDGAVPGRDFDYFYGPLSLVIPAGVYKATHATLLVERAVGAGYLAIVAVSLYAVGRKWTRPIGFAMGTIAVLIGSLFITALPITGAIGGLTAMVAFAVSGLARRPKAWAVGLAGAFAVGLRPEFLIFAAVVLAVLTLTRTVHPVAWIAGAVGLAPFVWLVATAGFATTWSNLVTDAAHVASERHLPWHANLGGAGLLAIIAAVTSVAAVVMGWRRRNESTGVGLLGLGVVGLCLIPEYLQRADTVHTVYLTMVPLAAVVPLAFESTRSIGALADRATWHQVAAIGIAAIVVLGLRPKFVARATLRDLRATITGASVYATSNDGETWFFASAPEAHAHAELVRAANRLVKPGAVLFVGPRDLERPTYTDGSYYTLLPGFDQRTHFYDFHPRIAQTDGARLADDVAAADVAILCNVGFDEANRSRHVGSDEANAVIRRSFERVDQAGRCGLYRRVGDDGSTR